MSEVLVEAPKVTVGMERVVNLGNYEKISASIFIGVPVPPDADGLAVVEAAKIKFADAHATLCEQLGIAFDVVEGVVVEKLQRVLGAQPVTGNDVPTGPSAQPTVTHTGGGAVPTTTDEKWADLGSNPKGWFDNRATKTGKQPDFKRKGKPADGEKYPPSLWADKAPSGFVIPDASAF